MGSRLDAMTWLPAALAISVLVFAWPDISLASRGVPASYPLVTAIFTLAVIALVVTWPRDSSHRPAGTSTELPGPLVAAATASAAAAVVVIAAYRWMRLAVWYPYHADMLIVIREATQRFLSGHSPYATYRSYDTTWDMVMPYGPVLWGAFVLPRLLRLDFRIVTTIGQLFVPACCGAASVIESSRGRLAAAASWLVLSSALVLAFDVQRFTLMGHTPVYWPLFPLFAVTIEKRRWIEAACLLGILIAARTTMVAMVPPFLMAVWTIGRRSVPAALTALAITVTILFGPIVAWDAHAVWDAMVLSYGRVMKVAVWPALARPGIETIGVTEWLLEQHREWLVMPAQFAAMIAVYAAAWVAIGRGRQPLPWMALALFSFSMTTLWPVHYLYYDVLLLLVSGALAATLDAGSRRVTFGAWALSLILVGALVFIAVRVVASPFPHVAAGDASIDRPLRSGFAASERDASRGFSWIVGRDASIVLPRSSAAAADIVLTARSPFDPAEPPQRMAAVLNGTLLKEIDIPGGWQGIRIAAPRSAWWVGYNELRLAFSSTVAPRDVGGGDDPRTLALAVSRVDLVTR